MNGAVDYAIASEAGAGRQVNQDAAGCLPERCLWLVADGMGGHAAPHVASRTVRDVVLEAARAGIELPDAIDRANRALVAMASYDPGLKGMGSTVAALEIHSDIALLAWVGDSRVYRVRGGTLSCLTRDHSLVQSLVDRKLVSPEEAASHPRRNVLMRALGSPDARVETESADVRRGDLWLICSDGISSVLDDHELLAALLECVDAAGAATRLTRTVQSRHGRDDATAVVIRT